jgi:hypothetical protein
LAVTVSESAPVEARFVYHNVDTMLRE